MNFKRKIVLNYKWSKKRDRDLEDVNNVTIQIPKPTKDHPDPDGYSDQHNLHTLQEGLYEAKESLGKLPYSEVSSAIKAVMLVQDLITSLILQTMEEDNKKIRLKKVS